jgi:hypothetical protein
MMLLIQLIEELVSTLLCIYLPTSLSWCIIAGLTFHRVYRTLNPTIKLHLMWTSYRLRPKIFLLCARGRAWLSFHHQKRMILSICMWMTSTHHPKLITQSPYPYLKYTKGGGITWTPITLMFLEIHSLTVRIHAHLQ